MRIVTLHCLVLLGAPRASAEDTAAPQPGNVNPLAISVPYLVQLDTPFDIELSLGRDATGVPANGMHVELEKVPQLELKTPSVRIKPGQTVAVTATAKKRGLVWVRARTIVLPPVEALVVVDFDGRLKVTSPPVLQYYTPSTLSVAMVDTSGQPLWVNATLNLSLQSSDAQLLLNGVAASADTVSVTIPRGARISPQFQVKPRRILGGTVHVGATLTVPEDQRVLVQEDFALKVEPAWWLPILLAVAGGLLHGSYNIARSLRDTVTAPNKLWTIVTSVIAGILGYLFANYDLLGMKLDPSVLRTYPLLGFLFSYFGVEHILKDKLSGGRRERGAVGAEAAARAAEAKEPAAGAAGAKGLGT